MQQIAGPTVTKGRRSLNGAETELRRGFYAVFFASRRKVR
jgi:hypothetical protein